VLKILAISQLGFFLDFNNGLRRPIMHPCMYHISVKSSIPRLSCSYSNIENYSRPSSSIRQDSKNASNFGPPPLSPCKIYVTDPLRHDRRHRRSADRIVKTFAVGPRCRPCVVERRACAHACQFHLLQSVEFYTFWSSKNDRRKIYLMSLTIS